MPSDSDMFCFCGANGNFLIYVYGCKVFHPPGFINRKLDGKKAKKNNERNVSTLLTKYEIPEITPFECTQQACKQHMLFFIVLYVCVRVGSISSLLLALLSITTLPFVLMSIETETIYIY